MNPTGQDFALIKEIFAEGGRYTTGNVNRRKYDRLEELGWLNGVITNISDVQYVLTEKGVAAAKLA